MRRALLFKQDYIKLNKRDVCYLKKELDLEFLGFLYSYDRDRINLDFVDNIYAQPRLQDIKKIIANCIPIDGKLLDALSKYEEEALNIIYRWRRSLIYGNDYREIKNCYYSFVAYWNDYIVRNGINLVVIFDIPHVPMYFIPIIICKVYNIPIIFSVRFALIADEPARFYLSPGYGELDQAFDSRLQRYQAFKDRGDDLELDLMTREYIDAYLGKGVDVKRRIAPYDVKVGKKLIGEYVKRIFVYIKKNDIRMLARKAKYYGTMRLQENSFLKKVERYEENIREDEKFFLFLLHLQPEATTLPLGRWFADQYIIIKMVSFALPQGYYLYVKEHPAYWQRKLGRDSFERMDECRDKHFYEELTNLNNVRLIKHELDSQKLIKKSCGLVSVTGSIGFECFMKKKPVIMFGKSPYNFLPNVYYVDNNEDCVEAVNNMLQTSKLEYDIEVYLKAIEAYMFCMTELNQPGHVVDDGEKIAFLKVVSKYYHDFLKN